MLKIILLIFTAAEIAAAETNWKGLRFGMSDADVRKVYPASFEKKPTENGAYELLDHDQKLSKWPATAGLYFDNTGKLSLIELFMEDPFANSGSSATGSSFAVMSVLTDSLVEKYGKSISQKGECELTIHDVVYSQPEKLFTCEKLWKSAGQTISMYWSVRNQCLSFFALTYKPLPSDI